MQGTRLDLDRTPSILPGILTFHRLVWRLGPRRLPIRRPH